MPPSLRPTSIFRIALVLVLAAPAAIAARAAGAAEKIFTLTDPRGDDHGDGTIRYPLNYYDLAPGDLDLLELEARRVEGGTEFAASFAQPLRSPNRRPMDIGGGAMESVARFGFYGLNLDIYVDTDRAPGSGGRYTLPGRRAEVAETTAWERAISLTPRPHDARSTVKRLLLASLRKELNQGEGEITPEEAERIKGLIPDDVERHIFFPTRIRVSGKTVRFFVPDEFLGGPAQPSWSYVAFVTGADIDQRYSLPAGTGVATAGGANLFLLPVKPGGAADRFGGRREDDWAQPPIIDLLVPPGSSQEQILRDYAKDRLVQLPGVVPAAKTP